MSAVRRSTAAMLIGLLVTVALMAPPAEAFTFQGGTEAQRAYIQEVISHCRLPSSLTDAELRGFGPVVIVFRSLDVTSYSSPGRIYMDLALSGEILGELAAHEWCHQIWYSLGPKWWEKWASLCGGGRSEIWRLDFAENFAECAKVALFPASYLLRDYAVTDLEVIPPAELRAWLTLARYVNKCPFPDLYPTAMPSTSEADELAAAGGLLYDEGITKGYTDGTFGPGDHVLKRQLALFCERAGLSHPSAWLTDYSPATRGEVRDAISLTWTEERWSEPITRGQLARLLWREAVGTASESSP